MSEKGHVLGGDVNQLLLLAHTLVPDDGDGQLSVLAHAFVFGCIQKKIEADKALSILREMFAEAKAANIKFVSFDELQKTRQ